MQISLNVNGQDYDVDVPPMKRLLDVLRDDLDLTGTKEGCGEGECGACSVVIEGRVANACLIPVIQANAVEVTTIEGVAPNADELHPLQEAFIRYGGAQCGICTPGMILAAKMLLDENKSPSRLEIREAIAAPVPMHGLPEDRRRRRRRRGPHAGHRRGGCLMPSPNPLTANADATRRSAIDVVVADSLADALAKMAEGVDSDQPFMPLAGGTDLMVWINQRNIVPDRVLDLWGVEGLRGISESEGAIHIGAMSTYADIIASDAVNEFCPPLVQASKLCGAAQIQARGTIGGNIAGGSPAGDTLPVLSAFSADLTLVSVRGTRTVSFVDFYTGYRQNLLEADELIQRISVPKPPRDSVTAFHKVGTRLAQSISKVMLGFVGHKGDDGKVDHLGMALGSVAPVPLRLPETEKLIVGHVLTTDLIEAARLRAMVEIAPIDDVRSTEKYRRAVGGNLVAHISNGCFRNHRFLTFPADFFGSGGMWIVAAVGSVPGRGFRPMRRLRGR